MLLFQLLKRNPCSTILPFFASHRCFSAAIAIQNSDPKLSKSKFSIVDYLVATFGFSPEKAVRVSKPIAHLKSPQKPDAVRSFLTDYGLTNAAIKSFITLRPIILCASVENTLSPNLRALGEIGLSTSALTSIILSDPATIHLRFAVSRINFWKDFLGGSEADLVKAFELNRRLITHDIGTGIQPKISLLHRHGLSNHDIGRILVRISRFIKCSVSTIEDIVTRAKEIGFQSESGMFIKAVHAMKSVSRDMMQKKMDLLKGFGWSEDDFFSALRKSPTWVTLSEKNLKVTMEFLMGDARCDPSYVASHPTLLMYSLEKRLRPRQAVLNQLESMGLSSKPQSRMESMGLSSKRQDYWNAMWMTNNKFAERYILPNEKIIPGLHGAYLASCGIQSTTSFKDVEV